MTESEKPNLSNWQDLTGLPRIFLAYPSKSGMADWMTRLAQELDGHGAEVTTWQEINNPGFLFNPIADAIDAAGLVLAETTSGNPNVLFELGYAIAKGKATFQLEDEKVAQPQRLAPLAIVRRIGYSQREDALDFLTAVDLTGTSLAEQMGIQLVTAHSGSLFFIPSRHGGDANETIWRICSDSPFNARTIDSNEIDYGSLASQAQSIAQADLFVTVLTSESTKEYQNNNAELMLFAGMAAGMAKDFIILVQQPHRRLVDLGENVAMFESESEAESLLGQWLKRVAAAHLRSPRPRSSITATASSPLSGLFLGHLDARADFELSDYFIETPEFQEAAAGKRHLFVGSKGSGKTANFELLRERLEGGNRIVVAVAPAEFEFPRLAAVFDEHRLAHWQFVYGSFWRFILVTEILRVLRTKFLDHLLRESPTTEQPTGKKYAKELIRWFDQNEAILSLDFVSRVNEVLSRISSFDGDDQVKRKKLEETLQAARMYDMERHLKEFARQFEIRLFIDDLDRNWSPDNESANRLIVALLNEIQTLTANQAPYLKPAVFIRKDVFNWLRANDPEFLKRDPAFLVWNRESLEMMIANRIAEQTGSQETEPTALWNLVFPEYTRGEKTCDFIVSKTLLRPRDVIHFCQKAVESAKRAGRVSVDEDDVYDAWEPFGELTLAQIETEYRHRYPHLGDIALAFLEAPTGGAWSEALARIEQQAAKFTPRPGWIEKAQSEPGHFAEVLYETGIIGVETSGGSRWFESDRPFSVIAGALHENFNVVIHPAFHRYLHCWGS